MMLAELEKFELGTPSERVKQDDALSNYAAKIEKDDCKINFARRAEEIKNQVRALAPAPYAFARIKGKSVKFVKVSASDEKTDKAPGTVIAVSPKGAGKLLVATGEGVLSLERIIPEGKKEMSAGDFVRGRGADVGDVFEI